jgi:3'-5' exoribonuclease
VAQAVSATSATFPGIDRDVAVTGALLHDIGKLEAYTEEGGRDRGIDLTDVGRLHGEIALGYYRIRREIEEIEGFPEQLAWAVLHIILAHHGSLEHGSPVVPCTREATLVHMIDNLGGRLGSFDRLEKELAPGRHWSGFDRALAAPAYFPQRRELESEALEAA